jgi:hypothetical protein
MFKVGQKVVFVGVTWGKENYDKSLPMPKINEIYTVLDPSYTVFMNHNYISLNEFGYEYGFLEKAFRPVLEDFGRDICEEIEKSFIPELVPCG